MARHQAPKTRFAPPTGISLEATPLLLLRGQEGGEAPGGRGSGPCALNTLIAVLGVVHRPRHSLPAALTLVGGCRGAQRVKRVPTQLGMNASGKVAASFWIARQPVQWVATMTSGAISANASHTAGISGSKIGPLR